MRQNRLVSIVTIGGIIGTCLIFLSTQELEPTPPAKPLSRE